MCQRLKYLGYVFSHGEMLMKPHSARLGQEILSEVGFGDATDVEITYRAKDICKYAFGIICSLCLELFHLNKMFF